MAAVEREGEKMNRNFYHHRFKIILTLLLVFCGYSNCFADSIFSYFSTRHPGWLGIDWVEVLLAGIRGGFIAWIILLCVGAYKKWFKK
jgi:hypothetical protein